MLSVSLMLAGLAFAGTPSAASAAPARCWAWSWSHTMKKASVPLLDSQLRIKWCADRNRRVVTGFVVESAFAVVRNSAWVRDPRSDVRPTAPLGGRVLHISADFSAMPTLMGSVALKGRGASVLLTWRPGAVGDHIEADLWPDGRISGSIWTG